MLTRINKGEAPQYHSVHTVCVSAHLDRICQRYSDSQWQSLWYSHHQHSHTNDEELDKVLNVDGCALWHPRALLHHKGVDGEIQDQDDDCDG